MDTGPQIIALIAATALFLIMLWLLFRSQSWWNYLGLAVSILLLVAAIWWYVDTKKERNYNFVWSSTQEEGGRQLGALAALVI